MLIFLHCVSGDNDKIQNSEKTKGISQSAHISFHNEFDFGVHERDNDPKYQYIEERLTSKAVFEYELDIFMICLLTAIGLS